MTTSFTLIEDVCARLCHDLGGPLGGIAAALDSVGDEASEAVVVAREGGATMRRRIALWRAAVGGGAEAMGPSGIAALLDGVLGNGRVAAVADGLGNVVLGPELARAVLLGAMLGAEALPRGGVVRIAGGAGQVVILPEGRGAAWPAALTAVLAGEAASGAREVLAPLLVEACARGGIRPALAFGSGAGAAPLVLSATS